MEDTVTITRKRSEDLFESEGILKALEEAGVEDWENYGDTIESYYLDQEEED